MGINVSKVSYTYNYHKKEHLNNYVLKDINLNIDSKGEFVCILGHTGSGKSTLCQMFNALLLPTQGEIKVDEYVINKKTNKNLNNIRKKVGLVFQFPEYQLFEENVLKDVCFGPKNFKLDNCLERAKKALSDLKVDESFYEKSPFRLSGGEKRKIAISGILAFDPDILILDEPTVGLDPLAKKELIKLLKEINKEKTVIIITHDMNVVWDVATRVILLDSETVVYDGNKYDLFKNDTLVKEHSLDYPDIIKIMKEINKKVKVDVYKEDLKQCFEELVKVDNYEW